jgi:predicted MFS family arabinose efflux permease
VLCALVVGGLSTGPLNPLLGTLQYALVPAELRGRVFGVVTSGAWAAIPAGVLLGGVVVEAIGVAATFLVIGVCYVTVIAYAFVNPAFRRMDEVRGSTTVDPPSATASEPAP